jgi:hypothetical protein
MRDISRPKTGPWTTGRRSGERHFSTQPPP